jgi:hypothetical protein
MIQNRKEAAATLQPPLSMLLEYALRYEFSSKNG